MFKRLLSAFVLSAAALVAPLAHAAVDANKASQAELEAVKGIGPALSAKILKARESGAFKDWNDLAERVPGIGLRNAAKFSQGGLTVAGGAYTAAAAAPATQPVKAEKPAKPSK